VVDFVQGRCQVSATEHTMVRQHIVHCVFHMFRCAYSELDVEIYKNQSGN